VIENTSVSSAFTTWLERLLARGESVQTEPPPTVLPAAAREPLSEAYRGFALDIAGPVIPFHADAAVRSALILAHHCWAVASGDNAATGFASGREPSSAAEHLSSDLMLRFFPMVYRRALARAARSELVAEQEALLRAWPLSGVLADLDGEPSTPPTFDHPGLALLYAERLVAKPRPGWIPAAGLARDWVERIFHERGKPLPACIPQEAIGE
jgi:hypothetical protein